MGGEGGEKGLVVMVKDERGGEKRGDKGPLEYYRNGNRKREGGERQKGAHG